MAACASHSVRRRESERAPITSAKVIVHRGTVCGGSYGNYAWDPGVDYPGANEFDFQAVLLHELGHAIGFNHSTDSSAVMWPNAASGEDSKRNLAPDEVLGLQQAGSSYGPISTTSLHRYKSASNSAGLWSDEGEPLSDTLLGAPATVHSPAADPSHFYLVAYTRASDHILRFGRTNGWLTGISGYTDVAAGLTSHRPPAVTADVAGARELIAYAEPVSDALQTRINTSGTSWGSPVQVGDTSRVAPSLGYLSNYNAYVIAWADFPSGKLQTAVSTDGGLSWKNPQSWSYRTFQSFGLACGVGDECVVAFADGESFVGRLGYAYLKYDATAENLSLSTNAADIGADTYGAAVAIDRNLGRVQVGWRDRGLATIMTSGGWTSSPGVLDNIAWLQHVSHAPPRIAYNQTWQEFTLWSNYSQRYDAL